MKTLLCIIGPSGAGKTTIKDALAKQVSFSFLKSTTDRLRRDGEGDDYTFVPKLNVQDCIESTHYAGHMYGITKESAELVLSTSLPILAIVDIHGYERLKEYYASKAQVVSVFVNASDAVLKQRLEKRGIDVAARMSQVAQDRKSQIKCDYSFINDSKLDLEIILKCLKEIIAMRSR